MTHHAGNQLVDPHLIFDKIPLETSMHIADFGSGRTGHIVFPAAQRVGERGVIYAVDILKEALESIRKRAQMEGFVNIHEVWADIEREHSVSVPTHTIDVVFAVNVMFHVKDYKQTLHEALRLLKEKGRFVVVDWMRKLGPIGPDTDAILDFDTLKKQARELGFVVQNDFTVGPCHRCMIFYQH